MCWWFTELQECNRTTNAMTKKIIGILVCLIAMISRTGAQGLGIELNGGLQGTKYQVPNGQSQLMPGGSLGMTYTFGLSSRWGFRTGILGGIYRTQASLQDSTRFTSGQVDDAGSAFVYNVKVAGYTETQQFFAATIPLMLHFQTGGTGMQWYLDGGGQLVFPFNSSIQVSAQQLTLSGYYPDFNVNVSNLPQHGFGKLNGWKSASSTELKPSGALSVATGVSFVLSQNTRLYTGLYADYGLSDLKAKNDSLPLVTYGSTGIGKVQANSVLNMQKAGAVSLLSFGIQLRLSFGPASKRSSARPKEAVERPEPDSLPISDSEAAIIHRPVIFGIVGETDILESQQKKLDDVADMMKRHPDLRISIVGHFCDSVKTTENVEVAAIRARAVARYLENKGIDHRRMDVGYLLESDPVLSHDPAANYRNRRVTISVVN